jgi:multidrug resistance efflux pump
LKEAEGNLERVRKLFEDGLLSAADLETAEANYESALANYSANELDRSRAEQRLTEIEQAVFQVDIPDGALLTRQSLQDLELEVLRLEQAVGESEAYLAAASAELEGAARAHRQASTARLEIPAGQVVWNLHTSVGSWANQGRPLLSFVDCSQLILDIAVDDATLELIEPGSEVRIRLFGSFTYRTGRVVLVRGSSALKSDGVVYAAEVANRGIREGRVLASMDPSDLSDDPSRSCGIGRTAYAEFEDINIFEMIFLPLFR